jgi:hypothetical protein
MSKQDFINFLIDEGKRKSFASHEHIVKEVVYFSDTKAFDDALKKWVKVKKVKPTTTNGPQHISNWIKK